MALVTCLLIMVVLAMIGIGVTMDSTTEIKIAGNFKNKAISFQNADSGTGAAPEIIEDNLENPRGSSSYTYSNNGVKPEITVNTANFIDLSEGVPLNSAITIVYNNSPANTNNTTYVNRRKSSDKTLITITKTKKMAAGNAVQMAAGYEGAGKGAGSGGVHAFFRCQSRDIQSETVSNTEIYYRHIP